MPSYVRPEQHYETTFNTYPPKFPRLPSVDFGVALSIPFLVCFVCGDVTKIHHEESKKRVEHVVLTNHTLDSFQGHLHIGLEHIHVLTPITEGVEREDIFDYARLLCLSGVYYTDLFVFPLLGFSY